MISAAALAAPAAAAVTYTALYTLGSGSGVVAGDGAAADQGQVVGESSGTNSHALLWSAATPAGVDLHPAAGFNRSAAFATSGTQQVGKARVTSSVNTYALLWSGTAASVVHLNPTNFTGFVDTIAFGVGGTQQVGYGDGPATGGTGSDHAMLWSGTAGSAVDLHPAPPASATPEPTARRNPPGRLRRRHRRRQCQPRPALVRDRRVGLRPGGRAAGDFH